MEDERGWGVFLGTYEPKLDAKGRLIMPAKFRDQLQEGLVLTRGQDRCLYVFPKEEFAVMFEELRRAPTTSKHARDYIRVLLSGASDETPDKQGRVTVPAHLRSYANLGRDLVVIGAGTRVEIWDSQSWDRYLASQEEQFSQTAEEIVPGLF